MTYLDTVFLAFSAGGLAFAGFVFWLIWPRDEAAPPPKSNIKPAE